uniref:Uncharacterized protein n=1 Tax=Parascaris equorum TaxID=6256 RepID=A0A914RMH2_PAREQ
MLYDWCCLQVASLLCAAQLLREDLLGSQSLAHSFILFIPLCLSESGWKGLFEEHAVERLSALPLWKAPPKQAFIPKKDLVATAIDRSFKAPHIALFIDNSDSVGPMIAGLYLEVVELKIRFCLAAVKLVECSCELLNHLMRNDLHHSIIQMCAVFISRVYKLEESSRAYIEKSVCLNALRNVPLDKDQTEKSALSDSTPSFNTPRKLFPPNV